MAFFHILHFVSVSGSSVAKIPYTWEWIPPFLFNSLAAEYGSKLGAALRSPEELRLLKNVLQDSINLLEQVGCLKDQFITKSNVNIFPLFRFVLFWFDLLIFAYYEGLFSCQWLTQNPEWQDWTAHLTADIYIVQWVSVVMGSVLNCKACACVKVQSIVALARVRKERNYVS